MIEKLSKQLFVGTQRDMGSLDGASEYTSGIINELSRCSMPPEKRLLAQCAVAAAFEAAGYLPGKRPLQEKNSAGEEIRPLCSPAAARIFETALQQNHIAVVAEWIAAARTKGIRPPHQHLPAMLKLGSKHRGYRSLIAEMAGPRGRWLGKMNRSWQWLFSEQDGGAGGDVTIWEEGRLAERCDFLRHVRKKDACKALEILREGMVGEKASTRAKLISVLKENISQADELFLEQQLKDRSVEVRRTIADLLSLIPSSGLSRRMMDRMDSCISFEKGAMKTTLRIEPPEVGDDSMKRDGIIDKPAGDLGARATMLMRIVASTPLTWWQGAIEASPEEIFKIIKGSKWTKALLRGLIHAAVNQRNSQWIVALLQGKLPKNTHLNRDELIQAVPPDDLDQWITRMAAPDKVLDIMPFIKNRPDDALSYWSETVSRTILTTVQQAVPLNPSHWQLRDLINAMAPRIHPNLLDAAADNWPVNHRTWSYYERHTTDYFDIIKLRKNLYRELPL